MVTEDRPGGVEALRHLPEVQVAANHFDGILCVY
jgi:hypothetical protein